MYCTKYVTDWIVVSAEPHIAFDANAIRDLRSQLRLTQVEFASLLGVTPATVGRWERGETVVQRRLQGRLAELVTTADDPDSQQLLASVHDITSRQEWSQAHGQALPPKRDYVETLLAGLRNGHVAPENWMEVARFLGREFYDAEW